MNLFFDLRNKKVLTSKKSEKIKKNHPIFIYLPKTLEAVKDLIITASFFFVEILQIKKPQLSYNKEVEVFIEVPSGFEPLWTVLQTAT